MKVFFSSYSRWWHPDCILLPLKFLFRISDEEFHGKFNPESGEIEGVVQRFGNTKIGSWLRRRSYRTDQKRYVKIDQWDVADAHFNLALIIAPLLVEMRKEKLGAPFTKAADAPMFSGDDGYDEDRWNWILNEMIFAFSAIIDPERESQFYFKTESGSKQAYDVDIEAQMVYEDRVANGLRLFGVYFQDLWT